MPVTVAEVEFTEWTRDGHIRHPSFKGLREAKDPRAFEVPLWKLNPWILGLALGRWPRKVPEERSSEPDDE
jgi:hypothetical protein